MPTLSPCLIHRAPFLLTYWDMLSGHFYHIMNMCFAFLLSAHFPQHCFSLCRLSGLHLSFLPSSSPLQAPLFPCLQWHRFAISEQHGLRTAAVYTSRRKAAKWNFLLRALCSGEIGCRGAPSGVATTRLRRVHGCRRPVAYASLCRFPNAR